MFPKTHYYTLFIALFLLCSCSDDDTTINETPNNPIISGNYFPTSLDRYWNYDVEMNSSETTEPILSTDELTVETINNNSFMLSTNNNLPANGTMNGILVSGTLTNLESTLSLNGTLDLPAELSELIDFDITLNNAILYDTTAESNTLLFTLSDEITQDIEGFPVTINYEVKSKSLNFYNTITLNNEAYTNVIESEISLNLGASTTIAVGGIPINVNILVPQDLLVITSYYAKNIGLVHAESQFNYEINPIILEQIDLDIPASASATNIQVLTSYGQQ